MENKKLAILGHPTRGKEVIEILAMLGGINSYNLYGDESYAYYTIDSDNEIKGGIYVFGDEQLCYFTLEQFLERYPLKVGDKVKTIYGKIGNVSKCKWDADNNCMIYKLDTSVYNNSFYFAHELIPYKEEIKAEDRLEIYTDHAIDDDSKTAIDIFVSNESLGLKNGYIANKVEIKDCGIILKCVKNKPQYPKTYEECEKVLRYDSHRLDDMGVTVKGYKWELIRAFQILLICRDAYWKIAGEEMGLSEPFEPDWNNNNQFKFLITRWRNDIIKEIYTAKDCFLAFPTEEMRDAFFENFKDLIEKCKEFL